MKFEDAYLEAAHEHCFGNEMEVRESSFACCISCARSFSAGLVSEVVRQSGYDHATAFCPVCTFDTVIADRSGYPVEDRDFIAAMNKAYFAEPLGSDYLWKDLLRAKNQ